MLKPDPIATALDDHYRSCCQPHRHQRTITRWTPYPGLAGRTIPEIRRQISTLAADHNDVLADLIRAHQAGDSDATTVLLAAFIPYVCSDPAIYVHPDRVADRWAALAHQLAVVDPDEAHRLDNRALSRVLLGRMRRDAARLRLNPDRCVTSTDGTVTELDTQPAAQTTVEEQALARIELAAIAAHLQAGTITPARWRRFVRYRIHGIHGHHARSARGSIFYTARQLAELTGHVA
jgi:hypothetical protein